MKIIKRIFGALFLVGGIAMIASAILQMINGEFWVGGPIAFGGFLLSISFVLLFDDKLEKYF